jgi:hypothetical protein
MRQLTVLTLIILAALASKADKPLPFFLERRTVDAIYNAARNNGNRGLGIECLEKIAEGLNVSIGPTDAAKLGIQPSDLDSRALRSSQVRSLAFSALGKLGGIDVANFLASKGKATLEPDVADALWPVIQASLQAARLTLIEDPTEAEQFLDQSLKFSRGTIADWAVDEVCNRGLAGSISFVRESIEKNHSSISARVIKFCEDRIRVLSRGKSRLQSLELALDADDPEATPELIEWAIQQLANEQSPEAQQAIDRFGSLLLTMPRDSEKWRKFGILTREIEYLRRAHVQ